MYGHRASRHRAALVEGVAARAEFRGVCFAKDYGTVGFQRLDQLVAVGRHAVLVQETALARGTPQMFHALRSVRGGRADVTCGCTEAF